MGHRNRLGHSGVSVNKMYSWKWLNEKGQIDPNSKNNRFALVVYIIASAGLEIATHHHQPRHHSDSQRGSCRLSIQHASIVSTGTKDYSLLNLVDCLSSTGLSAWRTR